MTLSKENIQALDRVIEKMQLCSFLYKREHKTPIHKVVLLRRVFGAKPGNNKLYKTATKLYDKLIYYNLL